MYTASDMNYTIAGPFLIMDFIYFIFSIFALIRLKTIYNSNERYILGIIFYLTIAIHCLYRFVAFEIITIITLKTTETTNVHELSNKTKQIFILIYSSDIIFWIIFLIFFWQLLVLLYVGHINFNMTFTNNENLPLPLRSRAVKIFLLLIFIYLAYQISLIVLFYTIDLKINQYIFINAMANLFIPVCICIIEILIHRNFSGLPYKASIFQRRKRKMNLRIVYWAAGRTFHGIFDMIVLSFADVCTYIKYPKTDGYIDSYTYDTMTISICLILIDKILFEILPFLLVLDMDFVKVFFKINNEDLNEKEDDLIEKNLIEENKNLKNSEEIASKRSTMNEKEIDVQKFQLDQFKIKKEEFLFNKDCKLGLIKFCELSIDSERNSSLGGSVITNRMCFRAFNLNKLSPYLTESIMVDVKKHILLQYNPDFGLINLKGVMIDQGIFSLVYEDYFNGSLFSLIHQNENQQGKLSFEVKLKICSQIARSLLCLSKEEPPISHGHLSSNNILFDREFFPKISDLLFHDLKKYMAVTSSYSNKNSYSAPEILNDNPLCNTNPKIYHDVYSFGILLWEVFTEKIPFKKLKRNELKKIVVEDNFRPKIPEDIPFYITNLIRCCWQQDPLKRPSFLDIWECLENHLLCKKELSSSSNYFL